MNLVQNVQTGKFVAQESELALVEAAIDGDTDSFTELCRRYYPAMVAIAHSVLSDRHFAEDAAQEAFAKAFCRLSRLRKKEKFACWLATVCRNVSRDMVRAKDRLSNPEDLTKVVTPSKDEDNELTKVLRAAVANLSETLKEVIFLRYYDGMAYDQISEVLGISKTAVDGRLRRAKKMVVQYLDRRGFVEDKS